MEGPILSLEILDHNPIRSGVFENVNEQGGGGGVGLGFKSPPPYEFENCCINRHHIMHVHFTRRYILPVRIFQKFLILIILQRFQNKKYRK